MIGIEYAFSMELKNGLYIWLSSYILMNIRNSSRDDFILRSRSSKNYC